MHEKYLEGFRKRIADMFGFRGVVFKQTTHLTFAVHTPYQHTLVHFALYLGGKRKELSASIQFRKPGVYKYVGVAVIEHRFYAFDYDDEEGLLSLCFET